MSTGIYIEPPSTSLANDRFFERNTGRFHSSMARCLSFVKATFEAQGIAVHTADRLPPQRDGDRHVYVSISSHLNYRRLTHRSDVVFSAFLVAEAPVVEPRIYRGLRGARHRFKRIYSCIGADAITEFVGASVDCRPLRWPIDFRGVDETRWLQTDRSFLVMINMNKLPRLRRYELFTERMRAVEYFGRTHDIDLFGVGWDRASMRMGRGWVPWTVRPMYDALQEWRERIFPDPMLVAARKVYRGPLETKWDTLARYNFVLCFENTALPGWLTEKLFECLRVGTIPVYWGATDIQELVPADCYIDMRMFGDYAELRSFLRSLDGKEIRRYRDAGRAFLESSAFEPFSKEHFAGIFQRLLEEDAGVSTRI